MIEQAVYVLTTKQEDFYYQQLMISVTSLKKYIPSINVSVLVDSESYQTLTDDRGAIFKIANVVNINVPEIYSQKEKSRFLKTTMREYITGDFIFIDCDTVICDDFSGLSFSRPIGMTLDRNCYLSERRDAGKTIINMADRCGFNLEKCEKYYNSGVIVVRDCETSHKFFSYWHEYWKQTLKIGMCVDQLSLNHVICNIMKDCVEDIGGEWNCQISLNPAGVRYIASAHIIHYFNTNLDSPYLLCDEQLIRKGNNSKEVVDIINNPRNAFKSCYFVTCGYTDDILLHCKQTKIVRRMITKNRKLFNIIESFFNSIIKIRNKLHSNSVWEKY